MTIWNQDEAIAFFRTNGYSTNYNTGLFEWLRDYYNTNSGTLNDLLIRYIKEVGLDFAAAGAVPFFLLTEDGNFLVKNDDSGKLILEGV